MRKKHLCKCEYCGKEWYAQKKTAKYCSTNCKPQCRSKRVKTTCYTCGKAIEVQNKRYKERNYCSLECAGAGHSEHYVKDNHWRYEPVEVVCDVCKKSFFKTRYQVERSTYQFCSKDCKNKGTSIFYRGENNKRYKSTISEEERIVARKTPLNADWRRSVYERDSYTCQSCGDNTGGNLNAHHLYSYTAYPSLRFDISNGVTLCEKCHKDFHIMFGYGDNTLQQYELYLKNRYDDTEPSH